MNKGKTIMYIIDFNINQVNGSQHLQISAIEDLLKSGFDIILIQKGDLLNDDLPKILRKYKRLKVVNVFTASHSKKSILKRLKNTIHFYKKVLKHIEIMESDIDFFYLLSTPMAFYFIKKLNKTSNKKIIFHVQDLYPESIETTMSKITKLFIPYLKNEQIKTFSIVTKIIVISEDIKNQLIEKGIANNKIEVIENWYWNTENVELSKNRFAKKFQLIKDKFIVQYAGNFGRVIDYKFIIDLAKLMRNYQNVEFQFVGSGSMEKKFKNNVAKYDLDNIKFFPMQPFDLVKDINSYSDICFISLKRNVIYHSVPSKASIAHSLGKPVLIVSNTDSAYAKNINNNNVGIVVDNDELLKAKKFILQLIDDKEYYGLLSRSSVKYGKEHLTRNYNTDKIIKIFDNI